MFGLTVDDFKILYFPKNLENGVITDDVVKNAKQCSDTFHDYLADNRFFRVCPVLEFMIMFCLAFISRLKDV